MSLNDKTQVTMTFTAHEWRLLAIAAAGVQSSKFRTFKAHDEVQALAKRIVTETGKDEPYTGPTTLTAELLAEAFDCFWNASLNHAINCQSSLAMDTAGAMSEGFAAVAHRLRQG